MESVKHNKKVERLLKIIQRLLQEQVGLYLVLDEIVRTIPLGLSLHDLHLIVLSLRDFLVTVLLKIEVENV